MLSNRVYIGEYSHMGVVIKNSVPPIVSEELFNAVQLELAKNSKAPARHTADDDYLLTTKLFCGRCGAKWYVSTISIIFARAAGLTSRRPFNTLETVLTE